MPKFGAGSERLARSFGRTGRRVQTPGPFQFDPLLAEEQRVSRQVNSSAQVGEAYAASRLQDSQNYAQRELQRLLQLQQQGVPVPQDRIDELDKLANPSFWDRAAQAAAPIFKALEFLDRGRATVALGIADVLNFDGKDGVEIDKDNYLQVLRGDRESLIDELGVDVVGEHGDVSFSVLLDDLGWEKTDNFGASLLRGVASFGGDVVLDPLTYLTFGAAGLAKPQRARMLLANVDDSAKRLGVALRKGTDLDDLGELGSEMMRRGVKKADDAEAAIWAEIDNAVAHGGGEVLERYGIDLAFLDDVPPSALDEVLRNTVGDTVRNEAIDKAVVETGDEIFNEALPALLAKDFANPSLKMVADGVQAPMLQGGLKLQVPFFRKTQGFAAAQVPGTRGVGRKISNSLLGHSTEYANAARPSGATGVRRWVEEGLASPVYERWSTFVGKLGDGNVWRKAMRGELPNARAALRARDNFAETVANLADTSGIRDVATTAIEFGQLASKEGIGDQDLQAIMRGMGRLLETSPNATIDEIVSDLQRYVAEAGGSLTAVPRELAQAAQRWQVVTRQYLNTMHTEARKAGMKVGDGLENYVPHMLTGEANEMLDLMIDRAIAPRGDEIGAQILRSLLEARRAVRRGAETVVGEAAAATQRTIGRTVKAETGDVAMPFIIGDTILHDKNTFGVAELTAEQLNIEMRKALDVLVEEHPSFRLPKQEKGLPFSVYNENPFVTIQAYGHDMMMAVAERHFLNELENVGLISDTVRYVNQQQLANDLVTRLGKYGSDVLAQHEALTARMLDDKMTLRRAIESGEAVGEDLVDFTIGNTTIQIPQVALEGNKRLADRLAKLSSGSARSREVQDRASAFFQDTFNSLRKQGVDESTAGQLAEAATHREVRDILRATKGEIRASVRRRLEHLGLARATQHRELLDAHEAAWRDLTSELTRLDARRRDALDKFDTELRTLRGVKDEVARLSAVESHEGMQALVDGVKSSMIVDTRRIADNLEDLGEIEAARMVRTIADFIVENPSSELTSLGSSIGEIIESVSQQYRQRNEWLHSNMDQLVAEADQYLDQALFYEGNILDPGNWGTEQYANARWAFHGTTRPNMDQVAVARHWGGGGISGNPVRASAYAGDGWIIVWDLEEAPTQLAGSIRAGVDIESRNVAELMVDAGGEGGARMPPPIAVLPARAVREALARRAQSPELLQKLARNIAADVVFNEVNLPLPNVLRGQAATQFYEVAERAMLDATYSGTEEFASEIAGILSRTTLQRRDDLPEIAERVTNRLKERLVESREWSRKGGADPFTGMPVDPRVNEARRSVLATWYDTWTAKARRGAPTRDVGEPVTAPWIDASEVEGGSQGYAEVFARMHSGENIRAFDPFIDPETGLDFEAMTEFVGQYFDQHFAALRAGNLTPEMRDIYDATQRSLVARGLPEEFPVWTTEGASLADHGMARMSLTPIEDGTVHLVRRADVSVDWGSLFPQQLDLLDDVARAQRHQVLVDPNKLTVVDSADNVLGVSTTTGMPPKSALTNMRPENFTYQKMLAIFGDAEVADEAYTDLLNRLNLIAPPTPELLERVARMRSMAKQWFPVGRAQANAAEIGVLNAVSDIFLQPRLYGDALEHPDVQRYLAKTVDETMGKELAFSRVTLVPDPDGGWHMGTPGSADGIEVTVPAFVNRTTERRATLTRRQLETKLAELGVTASDARVAANRYARKRSMAPNVFSELPRDEQLLLIRAEELFAGDETLFNTVMGVSDDATRSLDRAHRLAAESKRLQGKGVGGVEAALGAPTRDLSSDVAVENVRRAVADLQSVRRIDPDMTVGGVYSPYTGRNVVRGVSVGTGLGETRLALPEGLSDDVFTALQRDVEEWVAANFDDLRRPGAHISTWVDEGTNEVVLEIVAVTDTVGRARELGIDLEQASVFDLARGRTIQVPESKARLKRRLKEAKARTEVDDILDRVDTAAASHNWQQAEAFLAEPRNASLLRRTLGVAEYDDLLDQIQTERVLSLDMVPEKQALRAARQARKLLGNTEKAHEAARVIEAEGRALHASALSEDIAQVAHAKTRLGLILRDLLGVGMDADGRLAEPSLYPTNEVGRVTLEASEQVAARVREAEALAKRLGWDEPAAALEETRKNLPFAVMGDAGKRDAEHVFSVFGVGGEVVDYKATSGAVADMVEQAVARWQALTTPEGLEMFTKQARWIARAWKAMATVARPNFHPRNLIGGVFNGLAADVGMREYLWAYDKGLRLRRMQSKGASLAEMAEAFGDDWEVVNAARRSGIFGEGFAAGDVAVEIPRGRSGSRVRDALINPGSGDFIPTRAGGWTMRSIEDFLRVATFKRWYDELGGEGARDMVNMVHFDYANLSTMDRQIKKWVPFWVWTKNNIPLQIRLMIERPGVAARYTHLMQSVEDNFGGEREDWPGNQYANPFAADVGIQLGDDQYWSRVMFDPDLPVTDLQILDNPLSLEFFGNALSNMLGPHVTTPLQVGEQNEWGSTNAPVGYNTILKMMDLLPIYDAKITAAGDVQVGYGTRNALRTAVPILPEYAGILGFGNDPEKLLRQGITTEDGVDIQERLRGGLAFLGRGFGFQSSTPNDGRVAAYLADQRTRDIIDELKLMGLLPPSQ